MMQLDLKLKIMREARIKSDLGENTNKTWQYFSTAGGDPTPWADMATGGLTPTTWADLES